MKLFPILTSGIVQPSLGLDYKTFVPLPAQQLLCTAWYSRPSSEDLFQPQTGLPNLLSLKHDMAHFLVDDSHLMPPFLWLVQEDIITTCG